MSELFGKHYIQKQIDNLHNVHNKFYRMLEECKEKENCNVSEILSYLQEANNHYGNVESYIKSSIDSGEITLDESKSMYEDIGYWKTALWRTAVVYGPWKCDCRREKQ